MNNSTGVAARGDPSEVPDCSGYCPRADNVLSAETRRIVEAVCYGGVTTLLCAVGVASNVVTCLVFWRQGLRDRMNVSLFCLALADCSYLLCTFALLSVTEFLRFQADIVGEEYYAAAFTFTGGVLYGFRAASESIGMVVAVDRCLCVVFPLRVSAMMGPGSMSLLMLLCVSLAQLSHLIFPFMFRALFIRTEGSGQWVFMPTALYLENKRLLEVYAYLALGTLAPAVSFLTVSVATLVTAVKLRQAARWRHQTSSVTSDDNRQQMALTSMLVIVSCVYVITMVPFVTRQVSFWFLTDCLADRTCFDLFSALTAGTYVVLLVNRCINFVVYMCRSSRFRTVFRKTFCRSYPRIFTAAARTNVPAQHPTEINCSVSKLIN